MRILFLDLDTLRADHLGGYGYHRDTSPNIDRIAADGVRFDNYYCSDAPCLPSRAALISGRFGIHTGVVGHGGTAADMRIEGARRGFCGGFRDQSLTGMLRRAGLRTVTVSPFAERHGAWWFYAGFTEMYNTGRGGGESAEHITPTVLDWIERNGAADDWFLHVNYWDPHTPYRAPADFGNPFADEPLPQWLTAEVFAKHRKAVGPHTAQEIMMYHNRPNPDCPRQPAELKDLGDLRRMIDGYDCGIRYMDSHIGRIFDALAAAGVTDDLAVIISADHGENQGELGIYGEHATADNPTCRVPLIVRWPGAKSARVDTGLHHNLDLAPTLADLLSQEPHAAWDGRSFAKAVTDGADRGKDYLVLSQCCHVCQRAVRFDDWIYIRTYHDGYHLFPDEMLYNLDDDPHEQHDLAAERRDLCDRAGGRLQEWHDEMMRTMPRGYSEDPMQTVLREGGPAHARGRLKQYCERLEATGRADAIPQLKHRHRREFE